MTHTYLESHGVRLDVEVDDDALLPAVRLILPPGWQPSEEFPEDGHFTVRRSDHGTYDVLSEGVPVALGVEAEVAVHVLDAQIRARIAILAHDQFFIHAGVVALDGHAIVLPGPSFSGKSSLVAALVDAGATYYSDEFAVLDVDGRIHPYTKPLSLRPENARWGDAGTETPVDGPKGDAPAHAGLIVMTKYVPGTQFAPQARPTGVGALAMLTNAVPARSRTKETLAAVGRAADGAKVLEGDRGEAAAAAAVLLDALRA